MSKKEIRFCTWCEKIATMQTEKGKDNEKSGGLQLTMVGFVKVVGKKERK